MAYCDAEDVKLITGATPESFRLAKGDDTGLLAILTKWIGQSKSLIDSYCHTSFETDTPEAVSNVCLRLTANMVAFAQARRDTPLIKVNDWSVQTVSSSIFTSDLKADLKEGNFVVDKSNKSDTVDICCIYGDDLGGC